MKKLFLLVISMFVFLFIAHGANVNAKVSFNFKPKNDSIDVSILFYTGYSPVSYYNMDSTFKITQGEFEIELPPGVYICEIMNPESNITNIPIVVETNESKISFEVRLEELSVPSEISDVKLIARSGEGKINRILMTKSGEKWRVPIDSLPNNMESYTFMVNKSHYIHRKDFPVIQAVPVYRYMNKFKGEDIYFSENEYQKEAREINISSTGFDIAYCYKIFKDLGDVCSENSIVRNPDSLKSSEYYSKISSKLEGVIKQENPFYRQIVIEPYLLLIRRYHPVSIQRNKLAKSKKFDEYHALESTNAFKKMKQQEFDLLKQIDPASPFITGSFLSSVRSNKYFLKNSDMYVEYNIPFGFLEELSHDFKMQTQSYYAQGSILFEECRQLKRTDPNKAEQNIDVLTNEYPRHPSVRRGKADELLTELSRKKGTKAPDFELVSLEGDTIRLSDLIGKYVFLDFWGSWCGPCMGEIPNNKKLYDKISSDDLFVLGIICRDNRKNIEKVIAEKEIEYENAMATAEILRDFGVSSYPTTYLIDPSGIIIGKNLRGKYLADRVKKLMDL